MIAQGGAFGAYTSAFTGRIRWVQIDIGQDADEADHLIAPKNGGVSL